MFGALLILLLFSSKSTATRYRGDERHLAANAIDQQGYINIDCGSTVPDSGYQSDAPFIDTGVNRVVSSEIVITAPVLYMRTLRSFPNGVRNCYTLKASNGRDHNYLIRAHFKYGNYDGKNQPPVFDVYVGVSFWSQVTFTPPNSSKFTEIIHRPKTDFINICLISIGQGTPLISALFLRPVDNSIYNSDLGSLYMSQRYDASILESAYENYISYKDDIYDRLWSPLPLPFTKWERFSTSEDLNHVRNDAYEVPLSIFKGGNMPHAGIRSLGYFLIGNINPGSVFYVYLHFAETQKLSANQSREFKIFTGSNFTSGPFTLKYMEAITIVVPAISTRTGSELGFLFSINQTDASYLPPIINALEIYSVINISDSATNQDDVNAIMDVRTKFKVLNGWHGDPCLPVVPWNGLNCSDNDDNFQRIISLNLAYRGLTGEILPSLSFLTSLNYLNLSHNRLTGTIPEFLAKLPSLLVIDLSENMLSGSIPVTLMDRVKNGSLTLSLDGNPELCTLDSCVKKSKKHIILVALIATVCPVLLLLAVAVFWSCRWKKRTGFFEGGDDRMESKNRNFTYSEVIMMTNNLQTIIGKGGFGTVYHGLLRDGTEVAVKILNGSSSVSVQSFKTEAELLMRVHHRNLVSLVGYCDEGTTMALIYEYMAKGNLQECLSGEYTNTLSWKARLQISVDAAEGLDYLHGGCIPSIVHRDVKPANILLDRRLRAKLADFGMSRIFSTESASHISTDHVAGTPGYLDPEYYGSYNLNEKADVYSFGIILLELITGREAITRGEDGNVHIVKWVTPFLVSGDIHSIVDPRIQGEYSTSSAWKALETAIACVPSVGIQRPSMDQVLVDLKDCLALELAHEKAKEYDVQGNAPSNQTSGIVCVDSEFGCPSAR